jgi:hypothetical protein
VSVGAAPAPVNLGERELPPVTQLAVAALVLVIIGGVFAASRLPGHIPLGLPIALAAGAAVLTLTAFLLMRRVEPFAWRTFRRVSGWSLVAYVIVAGLLEYVFVYDHTPAAALVVLSLLLADFALDVALLYGYSVARFQPADG